MNTLPTTPGHARLIIASAIAAAGATTMIAILVTMGGTGDEAWVFILSATVGAGLSGLLFAGLFGHRGIEFSWGMAIFGALLATALGSFLGGMCWGGLSLLLVDVGNGIAANNDPLPVIILRAGAFAFLVVMGIVPMEEPEVIPVWIVAMLAVQAGAVWVRSQRTAA